MDKTTFFTRKLQTDIVPVPNFGDVIIKKLSQAEVEYARKHYGTADRGLEGARYIVSRVVIDEAGNRIFDDADQSKLVAVDYDVIETISSAATKFSGLVKDPKPGSVG